MIKWGYVAQPDRALAQYSGTSTARADPALDAAGMGRAP
jgi:hypothetical protein